MLHASVGSHKRCHKDKYITISLRLSISVAPYNLCAFGIHKKMVFNMQCEQNCSQSDDENDGVRATLFIYVTILLVWHDSVAYAPIDACISKPNSTSDDVFTERLLRDILGNCIRMYLCLFLCVCSSFELRNNKQNRIALMINFRLSGYLL